MGRTASRQVSWAITNRCFMACRHCLAEASPKGPSMDMYSTERVIEHLPSDGEYNLELTGGDPFCDFPLLLQVLRKLGGKRSGRRVTVHTTGQWATDDETARQKLEQVKALGADGIDFLCEDVLHFEAGLRRENYEGAVRIAREVFGPDGLFVRKPDISSGVLPIGRGAAPEMMRHWAKSDCEVKGACIDGSMQLHITHTGAAYVCSNCVPPSVGSLIDSHYEEVIDVVRGDPWHLALMESGPLGVAAQAGLDVDRWSGRIEEVGDCRTCIELTREITGRL